MEVIAHSGLHRSSVSAALATVFRGRFCDALLPGRSIITVSKGSTLYEIGDRERSFFFVRRGVVKVGAITDDGHEVIYDLRKDGDVAGELCVCDSPRRDRAVALEETAITTVPYEEILDNVLRSREVLQDILDAVCRALSSAYDQVSLLSSGGTVERLVKVLGRLARQFGRSSGPFTEIDAHFTQEEISQMMASSREKTSVALNRLRERGIVRYARGGHLLVDMAALESWSVTVD